ncbi:MAG: 4'-phosphopantetheinyl transferase superfamily protein [Luteibacter sp.]
MTETLPMIPPLADDEIHVWRATWSSGMGEARFGELLAAYAGEGAPTVARGAHGKPHFPAPFDTLGFNRSHSGDVALFAIGRGPHGFQLGVDVERVRPRARAIELASRFFADNETDALKALPVDGQLDGFLRLWTAKEAVLKAHGGGLSYGLHRVAFRFVGAAVVPDAFDGDVGSASNWQVHPLSLGEGLHAALAWLGGERMVRVFTYPL